MKLLGFGVGFKGFYLCYNDAAYVAAFKKNFIFNFRCGKRKFIDKFKFIDSGKVYEIRNPVH